MTKPRRGIAATAAADSLVGRTLAFDVRHRIRADIMTGALKPNAKLRFATLRDGYGASFSTLREALAHLVQEGLVMAEGQRGFRVAPVSRTDLADLVEIRLLVEREAIRRALAQADAAYDAALRAAHAALGEAAAAAGAGFATDPAWVAAHAGFHQALVAGCGSATLLDIRGLLRRRAERYLGLVPHRVADLSADPYRDHQPLVEAALARDVERLSSLAEAQIRTAAEHVAKVAAAWLNPEGDGPATSGG
jgi:DNA-binding GntR family transcriptional regulator